MDSCVCRFRSVQLLARMLIAPSRPEAHFTNGLPNSFVHRMQISNSMAVSAPQLEYILKDIVHLAPHAKWMRWFSFSTVERT